MEQIISVVEYLHFNGIAHRDLKPDNFLFLSSKEDSEIKIIDFGLSISTEEHDKVMVGTPIYMAPEVIKEAYDERSDNWSLGVIMYQLLTGKQPFQGQNRSQIFSNILDGKFNKSTASWIDISEEGKDLIEKFLTVNPNHRFTAA